MRSLGSLVGSGQVSAKVAGAYKGKLAVLRATRPQNSKMAPFNKASKDEGSAHKKAEIPGNEINHPTNQKDVAGFGFKGRAPASKGGRVGKTGQVSRGQIDAASMQSKKWIPGGGVSAKNPATGNTRMKGPIAKTGAQYGGGGRNTQ